MVCKTEMLPCPRLICKPVAIHMGFDCMAIGVGLFASIMATWPPNERFTYGLVASHRPRTDSKIYYQFWEDRDTFGFCKRHISYSYLNIHHIRRHSAPVSLVFNIMTRNNSNV